MPTEQFATIANLLQAHSLTHLFTHLKDESLSNLQQLNCSSRPRLLSHLKSLGVDKLGERQLIANALLKAEKDGQLPAQRPIPHLQPVVFDEDDETVIVKLKVPAGTTSNQLKVHIDVNSVSVDLQGSATACTGKLHALIKPADCLWELERTPRPEYDPMADASAQPAPEDDTLVLTLLKAQPARWVTLFTNATSRRYAPPPPPPKPESADAQARKRALAVKKRDAMHGIGFVPRKLDLDRDRRREERGQQRAPPDGEVPVASASEHFPSHKAQLLWRDGLKRVDGSPDHPAESGPLYTWTEDATTLVVSASTRRGLPSSDVQLAARANRVECHVGGVPTPWCGVLVGKIEPAKSTLEVVRSAEPDALCDTLRLTLVKAEPNRLWRAPFPELLAQLGTREKRSLVPRPTRDTLLVGGYDVGQQDGKIEFVVQFKAGASHKEYLSHDDFRVAVTSDALSVHIAGQEDAPILSGQLRSKIEPAKSSWRIRKAKSPKGSSIPIEELVIELQKAEGARSYSEIFSLIYS